MLQPLVFTAALSPALPHLFQACVTARRIDEAVLEVVKDGQRPFAVLKIELEEVLLSSLSLAGDDDASPVGDYEHQLVSAPGRSRVSARFAGFVKLSEVQDAK